MSQASPLTEPIYSEFGDDPDLGELVEMFVDEIPDRIDQLLSSLEARDWGGLERTAHQLKGAAGSYGFDALTPWAARLENAAHESAAEEEIRRATEELVAVCRLLRSGTP